MWGFLLSRITKFIPGMGSPYMLIGIAVAAFAAGGWTAYRVVQGGKVAALEEALSDQQAFYEASALIDRETAASKLKRATERTTVKEVIRDVKDDAVCDLPPAVAGVLDVRIQGNPLSGIGDTAATPRLAGISQSQSLNALDNAAEQYYGCRDELIAANQKYSGCEVICD